MDKQQQASRVSAVRAYLEGVGLPISSTQGYEVLARSLGFKNKHALAASAALEVKGDARGLPKSVSVEGVQVPVMALTDEPYSVRRMREMGWEFDVVVPFALDGLDDIERMNDYASQRITGNDYALESISFDHVPELNYGKGWVAYRVRAVVSSPQDVFEEEAQAEEAAFYDGLHKLARSLLGARTLTVTHKGFAWRLVVRHRDGQLLELLDEYARTGGRNNEQVNRLGRTPAFSASDEPAQSFVFDPGLLDLKYARVKASGVYEVSWNDSLVQLSVDEDPSA